MSQSKPERTVTLVNKAKEQLTFYVNKIAFAVDAGKEVEVPESAVAYLKERGFALEPKK
jgi:hypothetical protein